MKKTFLIIMLAVFAACHPIKSTQPQLSQFTDVTVTNWSDSAVKVFLTVQEGVKVPGLFDISDTCILPGNTTGYFWLNKGETRHLNSTKPSMGFILTFGAQNQNCSQAISNGWPNGINNFEFTINCVDTLLNPKATGGNESADITNVDGVNALMQYSVDTVNASIGRKYWDYSIVDSTGKLLQFGSARNSGELFGDCNVPGIFPYDCDVCFAHSIHAPTSCFTFPEWYDCSDTLGQGKYYSCQINRPGQGGSIHLEFFGFSGKPQPALETE